MTLLAAQIPVVETARLRLRAPQAADFEAYAETLCSERSRYVGGPFSRREAWRDFATDAGAWLLQGFGAWAIETRAEGVFCGTVILHRPAHYPEREIGWILQAGVEGRGYAEEAARAALRFAADELRWDTLVSYIDPLNTRSIALAERLGARREDDAPRPLGESPAECLVFRHPLGAHAVQHRLEEALL